jgi:hypothetical protein
MIAGFFARDMPPGVLEPQAGGCIAVPNAKDKKTWPK